MWYHTVTAKVSFTKGGHIINMTTETIRQEYECPKLKEPVCVTWQEIHYSSRNGEMEENKRIFGGGFGCNRERDCGVQNDQGGYAWGRCLHLKSPPSGRGSA